MKRRIALLLVLVICLSLCGCAKLSIDKQLKKEFWTFGGGFVGGDLASYRGGDYYEFSDGNAVLYRPDFDYEEESRGTYTISNLEHEEGDLVGLLTIEYASGPRAGESETMALSYLRQQGVLCLYFMSSTGELVALDHIVNDD